MKTKRGRPQAPYKLYTVYNNNTDMPIIVDGTAAECAAAMGLKTVGNFFNTVVRARNGYLKKWTILSRKRKEKEQIMKEMIYTPQMLKYPERLADGEYYPYCPECGAKMKGGAE